MTVKSKMEVKADFQYERIKTALKAEDCDIITTREEWRGVMYKIKYRNTSGQVLTTTPTNFHRGRRPDPTDQYQKIVDALLEDNCVMLTTREEWKGTKHKIKYRNASGQVLTIIPGSFYTKKREEQTEIKKEKHSVDQYQKMVDSLLKENCVMLTTREEWRGVMYKIKYRNASGQVLTTMPDSFHRGHRPDPTDHYQKFKEKAENDGFVVITTREQWRGTHYKASYILPNGEIHSVTPRNFYNGQKYPRHYDIEAPIYEVYFYLAPDTMEVYIGISRDSERRRKEHLEESTEQVRSLVKRLPSLSYLFSHEDGRPKTMTYKTALRVERSAIKAFANAGFVVLNKMHNPQYDFAAQAFNHQEVNYVHPKAEDSLEKRDFNRAYGKKKRNGRRQNPRLSRPTLVSHRFRSESQSGIAG